jgi:predicted dienelactone hydrolase
MKNKDNQTNYSGIRKIEIFDKLKDIVFPAYVIYPTKTPSKKISIGPFSMDATKNATIYDGKFPIVIISHGGGGNLLGYLTIAEFLSKRGFIVVMIEHYKNNRNNNELENKLENFELRPRHISITIDSIESNEIFKNHVEKDKVIIIGHSMGGYTALAIAGGEPYTKERVKIKTVKDNRVKAIILFAPATGFFKYDNSLDKVKIPILFFSAEKDTITTAKEHMELVKNQLSQNKKVVFEIIENAGHFSFLSPFPKSMRNPKFLPSTDPKGFDRVGFHKKLNEKILLFIKNVFY